MDEVDMRVSMRVLGFVCVDQSTSITQCSMNKVAGLFDPGGRATEPRTTRGTHQNRGFSSEMVCLGASTRTKGAKRRCCRHQENGAPALRNSRTCILEFLAVLRSLAEPCRRSCGEKIPIHPSSMAKNNSAKQNLGRRGRPR